MSSVFFVQALPEILVPGTILTLAVFQRWAAEYGDIFYYRAGWIRVYFLNHPDLIEAVLVRQYQTVVPLH